MREGWGRVHQGDRDGNRDIGKESSRGNIKRKTLCFKGKKKEISEGGVAR